MAGFLEGGQGSIFHAQTAAATGKSPLFSAGIMSFALNGAPERGKDQPFRAAEVVLAGHTKSCIVALW